MDVAGGASAAAAAADGGSGWFVHFVVGYSSSPLFFWLLTVALVAAIHLASGYISPSYSRSEDKAEEDRARRGGFSVEEREEEEDRDDDDRILEMMRSFSFMHASEEDFVEGMATYDRVFDGRAHEPAPAPPSLSFRFQHQIPEIPRETAVVLSKILVQEKEEQEHEEEKESSLSLESVVKQEHTDEAEEAEEVLEAGECREVAEAAPKIVATTHNYRFLTERDYRGFVKESETMTVRVQESFVPPPSTVHHEEGRVVDVASRRGGFLTANDVRPANVPGVRDSVVASPAKRTPSQRRKPARSPSDASKGSSVSGRTSFASEFSGIGDSDSDSSASDGYSVKELVVDSDNDWFLSEKDFPAAAHDAGSLRSYKAKVLKAIEAMEEAAKLERSFRDSATTVSPGSVGQASPDSIGDGSAKYPEDMWSRSPSPDAEYTEEEEKDTREAEEAEERNTEEGSVDMSYDDEGSSDSKKMAVAPVYNADSVAGSSLEHPEKETITIHDHSDEAASDAKRRPEAASKGDLAFSSHQVAIPDARRSPEPSEREFAGTNDTIATHGHLTSREEIAGINDQSEAAVSDDKRTPAHSERELVGANVQSRELMADIWKQTVSKNDQPDEVARDDTRSLEPSEREFVGTNEPMSDDRKAIVSTNDQPYEVVSDDNSIPQPSEQEFSANDHPYGVTPDGKSISEPTEEEHVGANGYSGDAPRHVHFSATGKAKVLGEEGEEPEDEWKDLTEEEEDELESLWEQQDLVEQLKLELKKVRSVGLPTILEESETTKAPMEDLKPWRMDAKFLREDPMDELNKFYKSYRERMRKFDILCYQKIYAIDFLQLREPQQSMNSLKSLSPTVTSILSHNFRSSRRGSPEDPSEQFLKELRCDLEMVYVGQMCLSWELLRWQYEQARDLPESDPYHSHHYNQVAGEFQQFQVMVQRFVEDESFKGPRLPNYINNRCMLRNLLQVPVIKEDSLKDRMEDQRKGNYVITSEELEDIMEEAMHILWEFIKADKVNTTSVLKGMSNTHINLQGPSDHVLMMHIHATLQKKEKRLKDLLRTGNCIVKKFNKPKEDRSNQNLLFSQVDMRLVARVLRMPRITSDQLQWCKAKLDKIILVDRKIHREPSLLLFPC